MSVDILIGSDYYWDIIENEAVRGESGPVAIKSKVGYILSYSFCNSAIPNSTAFMCYTLKCSSEIVTDTLDKTLKHFWTLKKLELKKISPLTNIFVKKLVLMKMKTDTKLNFHLKNFMILFLIILKTAKGDLIL